jgi:hypothetical protein
MPVRPVLLACYLCSTAFNACAIDSIDITIGEATLDKHSVSEIQSQIILNQDLSIDVDADGKFLGQQLMLQGRLKNGRWQASTTVNTTASEAIKIYQQTFDETLNWQIEGDVVLVLSLSASIADFNRQTVQYDLRLEDVTGELTGASTAFEGLNINIKALIHSHQNHLKGNVSLSFDKGLLAVDNLLLEPVAGAIQVATNFSTDQQYLRLTGFTLDDPGGLQVKIPSAKFHLKNYDSQHQLELSVDASSLSHVYSAWVQPVVYDTALENMEIEGRASTTIKIKDQQIQDLSLDIKNVSLTDKQGRFSVYELSSHLAGSNNFEEGKLSLTWQGAELYRLLLGQSNLVFDIDNKNLTVTSPFTIPLYDGELKVFQLSMKDMQGDNPAVIFDGILTPVNLSSLSSSMGWPTLDGSISGVIPSVRYENSELNVDGILLARAFDGTFKIQHLKISDLLSPLPRLSADFSVDQLDLEKLTRAFDFGRMEGKLSGHITGLNMVAWKANAFDAFFYTPEDDDSRHIISQRAVDNLTSLSGSDIGSVLSRSYLRFFENFRYDKLGVGCILRNNICQMNGIEAASGSAYYIVKGGLLPPRLDIIGYSYEVDWNDLLGRLERVMSDNAPVIQ